MCAFKDEDPFDELEDTPEEFIENIDNYFKEQYEDELEDEDECPNCGQRAYNLRGVEDTFGYRQMNKDDKFSLRRQSRCKKCR